MMKKLNKLSENNPFKVPDNYFEEVNRKIISATSGDDLEIKKTRLYDRLRPYFLLAASVTGFIILSYTTVKLLLPVRTDQTATELMHAENLDSYIDDIDLSSLEENTASIVFSEDLHDVDKSDIIDYLLLENIEISDIYAHL